MAGFLATELGYEHRKSQLVFEWHNVIPPFSRFLITFYHFNSPIVRPLSDLTQRDNHKKKYHPETQDAYIDEEMKFQGNLQIDKGYF